MKRGVTLCERVTFLLKIENAAQVSLQIGSSPMMYRSQI